MSDYARRGFTVHYREVMDEPPYSDLSDDHFRLLYRLIMRATFKERKWTCVRCGEQIELNPGDTYLNVEKESHKYDLTPGQMSSFIKKMVQIGILSKKSRSGCHQIISVTNWNYFTISDESDQVRGKFAASSRQVRGKFADRENNVNNEKNVKEASHSYSSNQNKNEPKTYYDENGVPYGNHYIPHHVPRFSDPQTRDAREPQEAEPEPEGPIRKKPPTFVRYDTKPPEPTHRPVQRTPEEELILQMAQRKLMDARRNSPDSAPMHISRVFDTQVIPMEVCDGKNVS